MLKELARKNRSYRRFYEEEAVSREVLVDLIDTARTTPSAANRQTVRFMIASTQEEKNKVFPYLRWAGYYRDWDGPQEGERPGGYILLLGRKNVNSAQDEGIIGQTILLAAAEKGYGGCFIGNVDRKNLAERLAVPEAYEIRLVLAIGKPKEEVVIDEISEDGDIKYYRDANMVHHVPKIRLSDLILPME